MHLGKEYDYVFDVDIKDGAPPLKLPFNASQNPYQAAQDFINANELPQDYLDQIANFIITNAKGVTLGDTNTGSSVGDPFTGGGRYVPGGQQVQKSPLIPLVTLFLLDIICIFQDSQYESIGSQNRPTQ